MVSSAAVSNSSDGSPVGTPPLLPRIANIPDEIRLQIPRAGWSETTYLPRGPKGIQAEGTLDASTSE